MLSAKIAAMKSRLALIVLFLATVLAAQPQEVEITSEPGHHLTLENAYVRVFKVEVPPHASTLVHWHRHDYMFVTLGASNVENDVKDKPPVTLKLQDGETHFSPAPFAHSAKNLAETPFRNVTIELLKNDDSKWDPDRGLSVLHGGTIDILFVKDGARVSEVDLQPGGIVPEHTHKGPHLVVAVTDIDLEGTAPGKSPAHLQLKSGDIRWVEGGITHTVTNVGKQEAKLISVEFH
jgi:quercetin dioxygenase-like cupin family protein